MQIKSHMISSYSCKEDIRGLHDIDTKKNNALVITLYSKENTLTTQMNQTYKCQTYALARLHRISEAMMIPKGVILL